MPDYAWPDAEHRTLIGKRITRVDSPAKVSGQAKYTYDVHRPGMLYGKVLRCPYPHAKVVSVDTSAAEKMPGVKAVHIVQYGITAKPTEDILKMLKSDGATDAVLDAIRAATVHPGAGTQTKSNYQKAAAQTLGDPDRGFAEAEVVSEGMYGIPVITHC